MLSGIIALVSALVVAAVGHILTLTRVRKEVGVKIKAGLYEKQITAYQKFWDLLEPLSYYDVGHDPILFSKDDKFHLNAASARSFFISFRTFFYSEHGIFLSRRLRQEIFELRRILEEIIAENPNAGDVFPISNSNAKKIRHLFDGIHTIARRDIGLIDPKLPDDATDENKSDTE